MNEIIIPIKIVITIQTSSESCNTTKSHTTSLGIKSPTDQVLQPEKQLRKVCRRETSSPEDLDSPPNPSANLKVKMGRIPRITFTPEQKVYFKQHTFQDVIKRFPELLKETNLTYDQVRNAVKNERRTQLANYNGEKI
jgi:hypothetical protein